LTPACQHIKLTGVANLFARIVKLLTPKRRWAQFSLATLFAVVTVLCVGLALVVVPVERQRRAVAAIKAIGGTVAYAEHDETAIEAFPGRFPRRWLARDYFDEVRQVYLDSTQVTDADLAHLQGLTGVRRLYLDDTQVTDAGLTHLQGLTGLEVLLLDRTEVTDTGLAHLQGLTRLETLWLNGTHVTDAGLSHLQRLTGLEVLLLDRTEVTDTGLAHLQGLTRLETLWLDGTHVTGAGLAQLRRALPNCQVSGP
jgi:hypothetical protein